MNVPKHIFYPFLLFGLAGCCTERRAISKLKLSPNTEYVVVKDTIIIGRAQIDTFVQMRDVPVVVEKERIKIEIKADTLYTDTGRVIRTWVKGECLPDTVFRNKEILKYFSPEKEKKGFWAFPFAYISLILVLILIFFGLKATIWKGMSGMS